MVPMLARRRLFAPLVLLALGSVGAEAGGCGGGEASSSGGDGGGGAWGWGGDGGAGARAGAGGRAGGGRVGGNDGGPNTDSSTDPCVGVTCNTPPANVCMTTRSLRAYP